MQMMRVEAIAEVGGDAERLEGARLPEPARDRAVAVDAFPGALVALGEFTRRHVLRPKDNMLTIVQLPVAGEDAVLLREPRVQRRSGKGGEDGEARQVDGRLD